MAEDDLVAVGTLHACTSAGDREEALPAEARSHDRFTGSVAHDLTATGQQPQVALADAFEQRHLPQQMPRGGRSGTDPQGAAGRDAALSLEQREGDPF